MAEEHERHRQQRKLEERLQRRILERKRKQLKELVAAEQKRRDTEAEQLR